MNCSEYEIHHKKIVVFPHIKHAKTYKISCGECHHDDNGEALNDLVPGDDVNKCIECHSNPSYITGESYEEQLEYHTNAVHFKCKNCHKQENRKRHQKLINKAPVKCNQCH